MDDDFSKLAVEAVKLNEWLTNERYFKVDGVSFQTTCDVVYNTACDDGWRSEKSRSALYPIVFFNNEKIFERSYWQVQGPWRTELPAILAEAVEKLRLAVKEKRQRLDDEKREHNRRAREAAQIKQEAEDATRLSAWNNRKTV